jgi:alkanesulfonate monooxygenase SsuD/methylene tetrahydromethanopterin reductase-like flavin-dependent oxidoreductase (luciferase family)
VRFGLALPQYDYAAPPGTRLAWDAVVERARQAERLGFDSLWLSDHRFLDLARYGGTAERYGTFEPLVTLGALARAVTKPRLGTLVLCEALRPATVLVKALSTLDQLMDGRLDVGIGAGWYEPDYQGIGTAMPRPRERLARLRETVEVCRGLIGGGPFTYSGDYQRAVNAPNRPAARQAPRPPIVVGGTGDRLLELVAELADGWNTCWAWTLDDYQARLEVLERACRRVGRDPMSVTRSLGLYALVGESERDLAARFERLRSSSPSGVLDGTTLEQWRLRRLVGTVDQIREQAAAWEALGIATLILSPTAVPFGGGHPDDIEALAGAFIGTPQGDVTSQLWGE